MGKSYTPAYVATFYDQKGQWVGEWPVNSGPNKTGYGRPTDSNAEKARKVWNQSFQPNGANFHVSRALGFIPHIRKLEIRRNFPGAPVIASAAAPAFEVV